MTPTASALVLSALLGVVPAADQPLPSVPTWDRWETKFTATDGAAPNTELTVEFTAPSGKRVTVDGFWDGGARWRVRFMPAEVGRWHYRTRARPAVKGLDGQSGEFRSTTTMAPA